MPQKSIPYAVARTRVLEGKLLTQEQMRRLLDAPDAPTVLRTLVETGYGLGQESGDYRKMIAAELAQAYGYVREVTPNPYATGVFMLKGDCHNCKVFCKAKLLGRTPELSDGGTVPAQLLLEALQTQRYSVLPPHLERAMRTEDAKIESGTANVQHMEFVLDAACYADMADYAQKSRQKTVVRCMQAQADLLNLTTLLRVRKNGQGIEVLTQALVPGGTVEHKTFLDALHATDDALIQQLHMQAYREVVQAGVEAFLKTGSLGVLERLSDDFITAVLRACRYERDSITPLVGYLVAKEREAQAIRVIMVAKINNVPMEMAQERLRDLYA